jgi:hypothetical protein
MAYFNHAFKKTFLATGTSLDTDVRLLNNSIVPATTDGALLTTTGLPTYVLNQLRDQAGDSYESGYIGLFDPRTNLSVNNPSNCCNLYIAGSAIYTNDKIGPFHGGYVETNKSKMINPKYVSRFYTVEPCAPSNEVVHVGSTYYTLNAPGVGGVDGGTITTPGVGYSNTATPVVVTTVTTSGTGTGLTLFITVAGGVPTVTGIASLGKGYEVGDTVTITGNGVTPGTLAVFTINAVGSTGVDPITGSGGAACCKPFLCGETYSLRIDVKGSPALRYLNHNAYLTVDAYTGCCPDGAIAPVPVDSTEVFIKWANAIIGSPIISPFMQVVVQDQTGVLWYAPGTSADDLAIVGGNTWDNYVSPGYIEDACAGMILNGAYVDTKFGDCTFQISDFYEKEPVKIYVSEVDYNGDPCTFDGICVVHECLATQANGLGETALRDLQLSEAYRQNFLSSDFRIREITQGNQIVNAIDRRGFYFRSYLQHNVPRSYNPTGTFDNDQYLLEFLAYAGDLTGLVSNSLAEFNGDIREWLQGCGVCEIEEFNCETSCTPPIQFPPYVTARVLPRPPAV